MSRLSIVLHRLGYLNQVTMNTEVRLTLQETMSNMNQELLF